MHPVARSCVARQFLIDNRQLSIHYHKHIAGQPGVEHQDKMTIRDKLNRQVRWVWPLMFLGVVLFVSGGVLEATQVMSFPWLMIPAAPLIFGTYYYMIFGIKCPHCQKCFFGATWVVGGRLFSVGKRMRFCPRCGVDFDSEM